jgi:Fe-S cluster assembly protein SufD
MVALPIARPNAAEIALMERYATLPLDARRERSFSAFARTGLPTRRVEAFKYSDLRVGAGKPEAWAAAALPADPFAGLTPCRIVLSAGGVKVEGNLPLGIRLVKLEAAQAFAGAEDLPMGALAAALTDAPAAVGLEVSVSPASPLHVVFAADAPQTYRRLQVIVREGASLELSESHLGGAGFSASLIEFTLETGAKVSRHLFQAAAGPAVQVITTTAQLGCQASFGQTVLALGARMARIETSLAHAGEGAEARLDAAYALGAGRHADITTLVRHSVGGATTRQLTRGVVSGDGRAVFQGKFHVARHAVKTDARMQHNALLLSPEAEVFAKPELQIHADDVQCAHGNTVGALDAMQVFYLRSRGIPQVDAERLLTEAFLTEALTGGGDADHPATARLLQALTGALV